MSPDRTETIEVETLEITLHKLTPLEWLDLEVEPDMNRTELICKTVAYAIADWNGEGVKLASDLMSDRSLHNIVFAIADDYLNKNEEIPELEAAKSSGEIKIMGEDFGATFRHLTLLELTNLMDDIKLPPAEKKAAVIAEMAIDWNGLGKVSGDDLWNDPEQHVYVIGCDRALEPFFRKPKVSVKKRNSADSNGDEQRADESASSVVVVG